MRRTIALIAGSALVVALLPAGTASARQANDPGPSAADRALLQAGGQVAEKAPEGSRPTGVNPYLGLVPDPTAVDYAAWKSWMDSQAVARAAQRSAQRRIATSPILVDEDEPDGTQGANDAPATAQPVPGFGTRNKQNNRARVLGSLDNEAVTPSALTPNSEPDDAIPQARDTGVQDVRSAVTTTGTVGDGANGSAGTDTGDFDYYEVIVTQPGEVLTVDVSTPTGALDPMVALFDSTGTLVAVDDDSGAGLDSLLRRRMDTAGTYYVAVTGFNVIPTNPNDPNSGRPGGGSEGPYNLLIQMARPDVDVYAVQLRRGDTLGASVTGSATWIRVYDGAERDVHGSNQDGTFLYPHNSPLPGGGNAVTEHVADDDGWHYIEVSQGSGNYDITVEAYRPGLQGDPIQQTLFLDFDGARVNTPAIWGVPTGGIRTLSPLRAFLAGWGLRTVDEDALINQIVAEVRENLRQDMIASGLNANFRLKILNSRDHADPWGQPNVSRIVVGGTVAESGIDTIGIAQSIDPGNFSTEETALVLLDSLSEPASPTSGPLYSLNRYLTPASNRIGFVAQAVGNVTSHEAGHFFGNWHVDQFNTVLNLMDQGGNFPLLYGVGPDGIGGTADDPDVDFGEDTFNPGEGFTGIEDTKGRIATVLR